MPRDDSSWFPDALYAELYRRHAPSLFAYAYQQTSSREEAEDVVLDVFLSVLQNPHFPSFDANKQEAWLWAITRNKVADYFRRTSQRQQVPIEWLSEPLYEDDRMAPDHASLRREAYDQLSKAIQALPAQQQEILRLRFGHGLKSKDIASVLAKSEGAVRTLLLRTLQRLRAIYHDQETGAADERLPARLPARADE
jgi:RNA polymerase sigma-70 factor (ECF subfamily)